jgi:hypothetical protein
MASECPNFEVMRSRTQRYLVYSHFQVLNLRRYKHRFVKFSIVIAYGKLMASTNFEVKRSGSHIVTTLGVKCVQ